MIWLLGFPSYGASWLDPALKWKTIETPHFSINYHAEVEDVAKRLAPIAEDVHAVMSKALKYRLDMKTQVTLIDNTDYGNGYTTVFPYPSITLYLTDLSGNLNPYKYDDYLLYLFLHEYTHALHLDMAEGAVSLFRLIFGRIIFPNALEPWFMTEGIATYTETRYTNAGRGRDPRWEMIMRMDVLEDNVKTIDQAAVDTVLWPMGHLRYLYGVEFLEYLAEKYGENKLTSLAHIYGDYLFSYGVDGAFLALYQQPLGLLWNEWLDHLREKYARHKKELGKLTEPKLLTENGYYNLKPKWAPDSESVYYLRRDADAYPQIRRLSVSSGISEKVFEGLVFDDNFGFSADGKQLLFPKADTFKNYYAYKDIYLLNLKSRRLSRLTEGLRASDPALSPDGKTIVFVKNEKGMKSICKIRNPKFAVPAGRQEIINKSEILNDQIVRLVSSESDVQYFSPTFSPNGKSVAAAKKLANGEQRIVLIDPGSGEEKILTGAYNSTSKPISEANPTFSPAGDYIFFDSDATGIVNLYALRLADRKLYRLTNVLGGAMMPAVSPDGQRLAYVSYSSRGYDLAIMELRPDEWEAVGQEGIKIVKGMETESKELKYTMHDYNPLPSLIPRFWIPYNYYNENGPQTSIYIGGLDPLRQHLYYLNLGYDFESRRPAYYFYYLNDQFLPQLSLSLFDGTWAYDWSGTIYWERLRQADFLVTFISNRVLSEYDRQSVTFGLQTINLTNISSIETLTPKPSQGNLNSFTFGWRYRSDRSYVKSISPEDGLDVSTRVEVARPELQSDYSFTNFSFSLRNYFSSPLQHQVLTSRLNGFYSRGNQLEQSNFTWRYLTLRGYPATSLRGNKGVSLSLEYRFPLGYPEKGLLYGYAFFDRLWGSFFFDVGAAGFASYESLSFKRAVGAELNLETSTFWAYYSFVLKLGYARGLDAGGEEKLYFTLGL